jgi:hypothetical protein
MNRAAAFSFALGSALAMLSGCIATPATGDDTGETDQALDRSLVASTVDKSAAQTALTPTAAQLAASKLNPKPPVGPVWTSPYAAQCSRYDTYTAALAEFTIACTGTIGPDSFDVSGGFLKRTFEGCTSRLNHFHDSLRDIDDLLKLQEPEYERDPIVNADGSPAMTIRECYVKPWDAWKTWFQNTYGKAAEACPLWAQLSADPSSDIPTPDNAAKFAELLPDPDKEGVLPVSTESAMKVPSPKENFLYAVQFPPTFVATQPPRCGAAETCANACSNGLEGFYVDTRKVSVRLSEVDNGIAKPPTYQGLAIVGDPLWWLDPTCYAAGTSPYLAADYYHPMSFYRALPGARYAHRNRAGEKCSYYAEPYHMIGVLIADCVDPNDSSSCSMSHCEPAPVSTPSPGSGSGSL